MFCDKTALLKSNKSYNNRMTKLVKGPSINDIPKGAFNNYVDKMRGGGGQNSLFLSTLKV